jgi:hypothetical protein
VRAIDFPHKITSIWTICSKKFSGPKKFVSSPKITKPQKALVFTHFVLILATLVQLEKAEDCLNYIKESIERRIGRDSIEYANILLAYAALYYVWNLWLQQEGLVAQMGKEGGVCLSVLMHYSPRLKTKKSIFHLF